MPFCTEGNCTSLLHCGSADVAEVPFYLQMSLDTGHKIGEDSSLMNRTFLLPPWLMTESKMGDPEYHHFYFHFVARRKFSGYMLNSIIEQPACQKTSKGSSERIQ